MITTAPRYRAWDKEYSHMYANAYPFEHLVYVEEDENATREMPKSHSLFINGKWFYWIPTTEVELMPYLPFRDKTGKTICAGDIVATGLTDEYVRAVVRIGEAEIGGSECCYSEDYYGVYLEGWRDSDLMNSLLKGRMYILGNIYEHPERLHEPIESWRQPS